MSGMVFFYSEETPPFTSIVSCLSHPTLGVLAPILMELPSKLQKDMCYVILFYVLTVLWYQRVKRSIESESELVFMRGVIMNDVLAILNFLEDIEHYVAAWRQFSSNGGREYSYKR